YLLFHKPYTSTGGRFLAEGVSGAAIWIAVSAALMNAFGEEIIFRGMLLPALSGCLGIVLAVVVQSLIFTVYHFFPLQNSVLLFMMGIFLLWDISGVGHYSRRFWLTLLEMDCLPCFFSFVYSERDKVQELFAGNNLIKGEKRWKKG
ncbi:MAG: CPBP family intramembrane metalloprotease, partial [Deltaproteobacteria bacterium]|nr:CPBP family intramembrane metalloprotease [Deltaproteobacteria bacterium]